eukprot:TRINITY_DN10143_c0_g1_i1.p1 TRINITY_DN10143_c0_g1~~TRINITY_DN10143_c0_g1_i1.p1  ORF type:complete len:546 (-),score=139.41 TRINITY_DN10143_c0_g1_i1:340-1977(-)
MGSTMCTDGHGGTETGCCKAHRGARFEDAKEYEPQDTGETMKEQLEQVDGGSPPKKGGLQVEGAGAKSELAAVASAASAALAAAPIAVESVVQGMLSPGSDRSASQAGESRERRGEQAPRPREDPPPPATNAPDGDGANAGGASSSKDHAGGGFQEADADIEAPALNPAEVAAALPQANGAAKKVAKFAKEELLEVRHFIQANHCSVKVVVLLSALGLMAASVLMMVNVFALFFKPYHYVCMAYNLLFSLILIVVDGPPGMCSRCGNMQRRLYQVAPFLAHHRGKAAFCFYVGSINFVMMPDSWFWQIVYLSIGGSLCLCSIIMMVHWCWKHGRRRKQDQQEKLSLARLAGGAAHAAHVAEEALVDAAKQAMPFVKEEYLEVRRFVEANHCSLKVICFFIALALLGSSVLRAFSFVDLFTEPFKYLMALYNVFFAFLILIMDGTPGMFRRCGNLPKRLYSCLPTLSTQRGRAAFCLYVGSMNLAVPPPEDFWKYLYLCLGGALCAVGLFMLLHRQASGKRPTPDVASAGAAAVGNDVSAACAAGA